MSANTCFIERSKVRELLFTSTTLNNEDTLELLKEVDALPIYSGLSEWRPIETAPKDGTEIIVFHPEAGVCAAFCPKDGFAWHCMDGSNTVVGSKSGVSIPRMTSFVTQPTRWMPLPALPVDHQSAAASSAESSEVDGLQSPEQFGR